MLKVGTAVVSSAVKSWLTSCRSELERESSLTELVQARMGGGFSRRRFDREVEALVDVVSERLLLLCRQEVPDLGDHAGFGKVAGTAFGVIMVAEFGDLTQIMTANLAARYDDPLSVGLGAVLALWAVAGLGIVGGKALMKRKSATTTMRPGAVFTPW